MKKTIFTLILILLSAQTLADTVYKSVDAQGNITFSTSPNANSTPVNIKGTPNKTDETVNQPAAIENNNQPSATLTDLQTKLNEASENYNIAETTYNDAKAKADTANDNAQKILNTSDKERFDQGEAVYLSNLAVVARQEEDRAFQNLELAAAELDNARAALVGYLKG